MKSIITGGFVLLAAGVFWGCEQFLEIDPPKDQIVADYVFTSDAAATGAVVGIYSRMMGSSAGFASGGLRSITLLTGLSSDELVSYNNTYRSYQQNDLSPNDGIVSTYLWNEPYQYIYTANAILEELPAASPVTAQLKSQLLGEAYFIRAFCYFYLTNLFGQVPLHLSTDYRLNSIAKQSPVSLVYKQIIADLTLAQQLLPKEYVSKDRARPNKSAATALLARVYLYDRQLQNARQAASAVIEEHEQYALAANANQVFLKESPETIWQLMPVLPGLNTNEANTFVLTSKPQNVSLDSSLIHNFEKTDQRRDWIGAFYDAGETYYYPAKYKVRTSPVLSEYSVVLRLAELYLIRAEANLELNDFAAAVSDINLIRSRAGLAPVNSSSPEQVTRLIQQERRAELFAEWGHRWFDLKRWMATDSVLGPIKAELWQTTDQLYPIPQSEISTNPHFTQNRGY